jgi:hypothetical protein
LKVIDGGEPPLLNDEIEGKLKQNAFLKWKLQFFVDRRFYPMWRKQRTSQKISSRSCQRWDYLNNESKTNM